MERIESSSRGRQKASLQSKPLKNPNALKKRSIAEETATTTRAGLPRDSFERSKIHDGTGIGQAGGGPKTSRIKPQKVDSLYAIAKTEEAILASPAAGPDPKQPGPSGEVNRAELEYLGHGRWALARRSELDCRWRNTKGNMNLLLKHLESAKTFADLQRMYRHPESNTALCEAVDKSNSFIESLVYSFIRAYLLITPSGTVRTSLSPELLLGQKRMEAALELARVTAGLSDEILAGMTARAASRLRRSDSIVLSAIQRQGDRAEVVCEILRKLRERMRLPSDINLNFIYKNRGADPSYRIVSFNPNGGLPVFLIYPGPNEGGVHGFAPLEAAGTLVRDLSEFVQRADERELYEIIDENVEYDSPVQAIWQQLALRCGYIDYTPLKGHSFIQAMIASTNVRYANGLMACDEITREVVEIVRTMIKEGFNNLRDDIILDDARMTSRAVELVGQAFGLSNLQPYQIRCLRSIETQRVSLRCSPISPESITRHPSAGEGLPVYIGHFDEIFEGVDDRKRSSRAICRTNIEIGGLDAKLAQFGARLSFGAGDGKDYVRNLVSAANFTFNDAMLPPSQVEALVDLVTQKLDELGVDGLDESIDFPRRHGAAVHRAIDLVTSELGRFFGRKFDINVFFCESHPSSSALLVLVKVPLWSGGCPGLNVYFDRVANDKSRRFTMLMTDERGATTRIRNVRKRLSELRTQDSTEEETVKTFEAASGLVEEKPGASASKEKRKARRRRESRSAKPDVAAQPSQPGPTAQPEQAGAKAGDLRSPSDPTAPVSTNYGALGKNVFAAAELDVAARAEAQRLLESAAAEEPALTTVFREVAEGHGGRLVALDNRLKSEASLERKIITRARERIVLGESVEAFVCKAGANVNDVLRYTVEFPADGYWKGLEASIESLTQQGITFRYQFNGWAPGSPFVGTYRGLNATFQTPKGHLVELQVHTPMSFAMKNELHVPYEEARSASTPPRRRAELVEIMRQRWKEVPEPSA